MEHDKVAVILGANSNLGFNIALRLVENEDPECNITFIVTSRTKKRACEVAKNIEEGVIHIKRTGKVVCDPFVVDLTSMESVKIFANDLNHKYKKINYFFNNAALGFCDGINWLRAVWEVCTNPKKAVTDPGYRIQKKGLISKDGMGYVFQANVFGTYFLIHQLLDLLSKGTASVVWISSLCSTSQYLSLDDIELINSNRPYDGSKRIIDLLHLATYKQLKTKNIYQYVVQPGIFISQSYAEQLNLFTYWSMLLLFMLARFLGSIWHTIDGYKAANSAVYVATFVDKSFERQDLKYGSATYNDGEEYIKPQEIEGTGKYQVRDYLETKRIEWENKLKDK